MAQNQGTQQPEWTDILKELEKIDSLRNTVISTGYKVDSLAHDVRVIKKVTDIDQNSQGQKQKDENVIDNKQLPTVLKTSEKKRYQNIGKEFVKGAGKEFERIKKAVQFKEKMKTSKQTFTQSAKKVKQNVKKTVKKNDFWKKLLAIIGVIGLVVFMFRDKIAKLLPDLSGGMEGMGTKIIDFFGGLISELGVFVSSFVGSSLTGIIKYACDTIIPNVMTGFFQQTLPLAMVASTLSVMSMFSESAGQQLDSLLDSTSQQEADAKAQQTAQNAEDELNDRYKGPADPYRQQLIGNYSDQAALDLYNRYGNYLYTQNKLQEYNELFNMINRSLPQNESLSALVSSNRINLTALMQDINEINSRTGLTQQMKRKQFAEAISKHLRLAGISLDQQKMKALTQYVGENLSHIAGLGQFFNNDAITRALRQKAQRALTTAGGGVARVDISTPQLDVQEQQTTFVTKINVSQAIATKFMQPITQVLNSLDSVLRQNNNENVFESSIKGYFEGLSKLCNEFFVAKMIVLGNILRNGYRFFAGQFENGSRGSTGGIGVTQISLSNGGNAISNSNILISNVIIQDPSVAQMGAILGEMKNSTASINNQVQKSHRTLVLINSALSSKLTVNTNTQTIDSSVITESVKSAIQPLSNSVRGHQVRISKLQNPQQPASGNGSDSNTTFSQ